MRATVLPNLQDAWVLGKAEVRYLALEPQALEGDLDSSLHAFRGISLILSRKSSSVSFTFLEKRMGVPQPFVVIDVTPTKEPKGKERAREGDILDEDFATQGFEPHESDSEQLYDVVEIKGEKRGMYLVQWAGVDENGKPWDDSWVPRQDVTDDLVEAWKRKKAEMKVQKVRGTPGRRGRKRRGSSMSASKSRTDSKRSSTTTSNVTPRRFNRKSSVTTIGRAEVDSPLTVRSTPTKKRKQDVLLDDSDDKHTSASRKRRKTVPEVELQRFPGRRPNQRPSDSAEEVDSDQEEPDLEDNAKAPSRHKQGAPRATSEVKLNSKPRKVVTHREEGEEEREAIAGPSRDPVQRQETRISSPGMKGKSRSSVPAERSPEDRISDRRPTPPRRTLTKSASARSESRSTIIPSARKEEAPNRQESPGVRISSADKRAAMPEASRPKSRKQKSLAASDLSSGSVTAEERTNGQHGSSRSQSIEADHSVIVMPSKMRQRSTSSLKGKEKQKIHDNNSQRSRSISVSLQHSPKFPAAVLPESLDISAKRPNGANDGGIVYNYNPDDHPLLDDIDYESYLPWKIERRADAADDSKRTTNGDTAHSRGPEPNTGSKVADQNNSQAEKDIVIPATQSQFESLSRSDALNGTEDSAQFASVIATYGSPTDVGRGINDAVLESIVSIPLDSPIVADEPPGTADQSVTDPEPSAPSSMRMKVHGKIPAMSPSQFRPYLPEPRKPLSALPPPHIQGMQNTSTQGEDIQPASSLESPIKCFDTEETGTREQDLGVDVGKNRHAEEDEDDDIDDKMPLSIEYQRRGLRLAEKRRESIRNEVREPVSRVQLDDLLSSRSVSRTESHDTDASNSRPSDGELSETLSEVAEKSTSKAWEEKKEDEDDEARVRQFEEDYVDFEGNAGAASLDAGTPRQTLDNAQSTKGDLTGGDATIEPEADAYEEVNVESSPDGIHEDDPFVSRANAIERGATASTTSSQQDDMDLPNSPAQPRFKILGSPSKFELPVQTSSRQFNEAMALLHAKSEEIEALKRQLEESEEKRLSQDDTLAELRAENLVLKKTEEKQADSLGGASSEELEQYKEKCESLAKDRDALDAEIKLLKMGRDDAVKQGEIFRELYGQASAFADETKRENQELSERTKRAEGQATIGVELVRRQYAAQEQKLKAELEQQQTLVHILSAKDKRTDDEVRRRAALEPELRAEISKLREEIGDLEATQAKLVRARNDLLVEKQELADELDETRGKYSKIVDDMRWLQIRISRLTAREKAFKKVFLTTSESMQANDLDRGEEKVYICKWMNHESNSRCNSLFANVQMVPISAAAALQFIR
ncbi:uncharacterized protein FOMMEDRAFT_156633 [Fomitiporia mediterranea MF3/22]|uniref:uncharacterized protein n=1 Tax=Fomitiporia mediterranea (strain MF3/22) TaxID=694068 RepID=UPI000440778F|nr:uncharacterized protein FOMMEDRAFT_156633 [Fomitiporia mediterranea MF3/22]EJD03248.1 hypothetical protein FOMMEDRAFT_156633 [Fomitiporia mediterranea MF3/22]